MNVEIGSGGKAMDGWVAVDINPRTAGVVADARALPFRDGVVRRMRAIDVLEHISYYDTDRTLAEWARVLAPGGYLFVQVPDAGRIMEWYAKGDERLRTRRGTEAHPMEGAAWRLLGGHFDPGYYEDGDDWRWLAHYAAFDADWLTRCLDLAGLAVKSMHSNEHPNLMCEATKR